MVRCELDSKKNKIIIIINNERISETLRVFQWWWEPRHHPGGRRWTVDFAGRFCGPILRDDYERLMNQVGDTFNFNWFGLNGCRNGGAPTRAGATDSCVFTTSSTA